MPNRKLEDINNKQLTKKYVISILTCPPPLYCTCWNYMLWFYTFWTQSFGSSVTSLLC